MHSWKKSSAPSEPRDPTSTVDGRCVAVQPQGKGMAGSQINMCGWELHTPAGGLGWEEFEENWPWDGGWGQGNWHREM